MRPEGQWPVRLPTPAAGPMCRWVRSGAPSGVAHTRQSVVVPGQWGMIARSQGRLPVQTVRRGGVWA
jgi:hypothetical protein